MEISHLRKILPVISMLLLCASAQAGFYAGIAGGQSRTGRQLVENREGTITNTTSVSTRFDAEDSAWKGFAGWRFHRFLAVEAAYVDLGEHRMVTSITNLLGPGTVDIKRRIKGPAAFLVASFPVHERLALSAKAGLMRAGLDADARLGGAVVFNPGDPSETFRTVSRTENVPAYGLGLSWDVRPGWGLRLEWERYARIGKPFAVGGTGNTGEADTDLASLGVVFRF